MGLRFRIGLAFEHARGRDPSCGIEKVTAIVRHGRTAIARPISGPYSKLLDVVGVRTKSVGIHADVTSREEEGPAGVETAGPRVSKEAECDDSRAAQLGLG